MRSGPASADRNNDDPIVFPTQPGRSHNHTYIGKPVCGYASFEVPDGSLSINDQIFAPVGFETREPGETAKDRAALIFEVESVDAETERLRAAAFETEPTSYPGWGIQAAHLRDPDGNLIEINELLPPAEWSHDLREEQDRYRRS